MDELVGMLLVSLLVTWGVGLAPPLLIRFVVLGRPLSKWPAIAIVAVLWVGNLLLFTALGSESRTHSALLLVAIVSYAILIKGAAKPETPTSGPGTQPESSSPNDEGISEAAPATRHDFGRFLAHEALTWTTSGEPSPAQALKDWDIPRSVTESRVVAEAYLLHLAAFVEASLSFGVDGMEVQAAMIQEAAGVVEGFGGTLGANDGDAAALVQEALEDYVGSGPTGTSMSDILRFGLIAIERIFGQPHRDPGAAIFLVQVFQSAQQNASDLIGNVLAEGLGTSGSS